MSRTIKGWALALLLVAGVAATDSKAAQEGARGSWLFSPGVGFTSSPGAFLLAPQLDYVAKSWLYYGPFLDIILADGATLFTPGGFVRVSFGNHPRVRPTGQVGAGVTFASAGADTVGFHFHFGMGVDYILQPGFTIGTMIKAAFNSPIDSFMLNWPVLIGRFSF